ncbi:hypothetical protein B0H14DRAFT_2387522, partial [Mycena olivaceomarginata]
DVSAQARKFQIVWQGQRVSIGGTSAVTPTFAGLVALLNDARLAAPRSGFSIPCCINAARNAFKEVIDGANPGCGTPGFKVRCSFDDSLSVTELLVGDQGMGTSLHERSTD